MLLLRFLTNIIKKNLNLVIFSILTAGNGCAILIR